MGDYGPANEETAVYSTLEVPGLEPDYTLVLNGMHDFSLGDLIDYLKNQNQDEVYKFGFCNPHSYRGYYEQLAFEPSKNVKVSQMLNLAEASLGVEFQGYKGGGF